MATVSEESQKLGLAYSLITVLFLLCVFGRKCLCCCSPRREYNGNDENYQNMNGIKKPVAKYVMYFGIMYLMTLVNYLSAVIYLVANNKN